MHLEAKSQKQRKPWPNQPLIDTVAALIDMYKEKFGSQYADIFTATVKIGL